MAVANIQITQGAVVGGAGQSVIGLDTTTAITLTDAGGPGATGYLWEFVSFPGPLSGAPAITNATSQVATITPSPSLLDGVYLLRLTRTDPTDGVSTMVRLFAVGDDDGLALPSAGMNRNIVNVAGSALAQFAGWFGSVVGGTNIFLDAFLRLRKKREGRYTGRSASVTHDSGTPVTVTWTYGVTAPTQEIVATADASAEYNVILSRSGAEDGATFWVLVRSSIGAYDVVFHDDVVDEEVGGIYYASSGGSWDPLEYALQFTFDGTAWRVRPHFWPGYQESIDDHEIRLQTLEASGGGADLDPAGTLNLGTVNATDVRLGRVTNVGTYIDGSFIGIGQDDGAADMINIGDDNATIIQLLGAETYVYGDTSVFIDTAGEIAFSANTFEIGVPVWETTTNTAIVGRTPALNAAPYTMSLRGGSAFASAVGANRIGAHLSLGGGRGATPGTDLGGNVRISVGRHVADESSAKVMVTYGDATDDDFENELLSFYRSTLGFATVGAPATLEIVAAAGDATVRAPAGTAFLGGLYVDQFSDDWWYAEATSTLDFVSGGAMTFDNTGGTSNMSFGTNGQFYVASNDLSISNNDSAGNALLYSHNTMEITARKSLLIRSNRLGTTDLPAPPITIMGGQALTNSVGATNRRGGAIIVEAGKGRTPGTDEPGPIYMGIGSPISTTVTNGFIIGYGAAVGTLNDPAYIPYTTELVRITYVLDECKVRTNNKALRLSSVGNMVAEVDAGSISLAVAASTKFQATSTTTTIANSGVVQVQSTGGPAHLIAQSANVCSMNGGNMEFRSATRIANFQNGNASETRFIIGYPADVAIASTPSTYTTLTTVPLSGATGGRPRTLTGVVHVWEAGGATQRWRFEVTFRPDGATGTMVGAALIEPPEGDTLGTLEIDSTGGCRVRFLSDAGSVNAKTGSVTGLDFQ